MPVFQQVTGSLIRAAFVVAVDTVRGRKIELVIDQHDGQGCLQHRRYEAGGNIRPRQNHRVYAAVTNKSKIARPVEYVVGERSNRDVIIRARGGLLYAVQNFGVKRVGLGGDTRLLADEEPNAHALRSRANT